MSSVSLSWLLIGWGVMALVMAGLWGFQRRTGDAGIVDVAWGMGVGLLAASFACLGPGDRWRRTVVGSLAMIWALRLSGYILARVLTMPEDGRYASLKRDWGDAAPTKLFVFFQFQAIASLLFSLPMWFAVHAVSPWGVWDRLGVAIWCVAILGESLADRQLARFRDDPANRGKVCREGLWRYSRHPNYFFEWLHWWSYVCFARTAPWGWLTILGPLTMLYLILRVTGIPPTESQALRSRGEAYREYQRTTNAFFPWFPRPWPTPK